MAQDDDVDMATLPIDADKADPITKAVEIVDVSRSATLLNTLESDVLKIALNPEEQQLFDTLKKTVIAWSEGKLTLGTKSVEIRVAGGWVRDKILGLETHDVDIALDACTGVEFAHAVKEYHTSQQDQGESSTSKNNKIGKIGVIAANPDQSKHLETACVNIFGNDVDFSNLRHETYAEDSRIPETVMGTPLEDSFRRDATMNALYYNLNTGRIEDWTRRGLQDLLETKVINTPLKAFQTFQDDPLRVLRLIRFAVRYKMQLSEEITDACQHPEIHQQLHRKVSRERVGNELEGMLSGKLANPILAMDLISRMNLADSVFCPPEKFVIEGPICQANLKRKPYMEPNTDKNELTRLRAIAWEESRECLKTLSMVLEAFSPVIKSTTTIDTRLVYLAVVLLPYYNLHYQDKSKSKSVIEYMMRDGIKFKNKDVISMGLVTQNLKEMIMLFQLTEDYRKDSMHLRLNAGLALRSTKEMWVTTLMVATVWLSRIPGYGQDVNGVCGKAIELYKAIIGTMNLDECWKKKPPMNGKELIQLLGLKRGPEVGVYMEEQVRWTLTHPNSPIEELHGHLKFFKNTQEGGPPVSKKIHI
eukprot:CAMPEP_0116153450 /NCGR_PEP_ID=MMETSP0329-20121206/21253_1 /TAXON_ID=697910 /ORGANISM="Pseudo-nitzschia arenysensis, Strain B593" /LENGTH=588 /DNA_ID=CAMNT_0003650363 /DNA_START=142 /DNA_END=1908 /DNA_ORIENTATION=-